MMQDLTFIWRFYLDRRSVLNHPACSFYGLSGLPGIDIGHSKHGGYIFIAVANVHVIEGFVATNATAITRLRSGGN